MPSILRLAFGVVCVALIDQSSKFAMQRIEGVDLMHNLLVLQTIHNDGIAFGLPLKGIFLIIVTVLILIVLFSLALFHMDLTRTLSLITFSLLLGGGIGNLLDRVIDGRVTDFIRFWHFPVFNVADAAVTIGAAMLLLFYDRMGYTRVSVKHKFSSTHKS